MRSNLLIVGAVAAWIALTALFTHGGLGSPTINALVGVLVMSMGVAVFRSGWAVPPLAAVSALCNRERL